jgi:hypothetical protein
MRHFFFGFAGIASAVSHRSQSACVQFIGDLGVDDDEYWQNQTMPDQCARNTMPLGGCER